MDLDAFLSGLSSRQLADFNAEPPCSRKPRHNPSISAAEVEDGPVLPSHILEKGGSQPLDVVASRACSLREIFVALGSVIRSAARGRLCGFCHLRLT
jgi:hypothetical protein